jgi:hypothetical protein
VDPTHRLAAWNDLPEAARARVLERALRPLQEACDQEERDGYLCVMRKPVAAAVAAVKTTENVVVTTCGHFRVSHYAQSGSDWGEHFVWVYEFTLDSDLEIVVERRIEQSVERLSEADEETYDDAYYAMKLVEDLVRAGRVRAP